MRNLTPSHLRCGGSLSGCPSITQLEDGRLLIVGKDYNDDAAAQLAVFNADGIQVSSACDEAAIVIDPSLLSDYISHQIEAALSAGALVIPADTYIRLRDWLETGKSAAQGFTSGLERQIAYVIEAAISKHVEAAVRAEREACAKIADFGMMVPPDGGSATPDECQVAENIAAAIRSRGNANG